MIACITHSIFRLKRTASISAVMVLLASSPANSWQPQEQVEDQDAADTRVLDPTAVAVFRVNLEKFKLKECTDFVKARTLGKIPESAWASSVSFVSPILAALNKSGATELTVSVSPSGIPSGMPAIVIKSLDPAATKRGIAFIAGLLSSYNMELHEQGSYVVLCTDECWERIEAGASHRVDLLAALERQVELDSILSATVAIEDALAQSVASLFPDSLPKFSPVTLSPKQMVGDIRSVSVSLLSFTDPQARLLADCRTKEAAKRTLAEVNRLLEPIAVELDRQVAGRQLTLSANERGFNSVLDLLLKQSAEASGTVVASNNLKRVSLAFHEFVAKHGYFVPRATIDENGQPLLSWRVHLLPFLGEEQLYSLFHLDEPWNSPHNSQLALRVPSVYRMPNSTEHVGQTCIQVPMLEGSYWYGSSTKPRTWQDTRDDNETICFVLSSPGQSVTWTEPVDLKVDAERIHESLFGGLDSILIARFNSAVVPLSRESPAEEIVAQLTHASGD